MNRKLWLALLGVPVLALVVVSAGLILLLRSSAPDPSAFASAAASHAGDVRVAALFAPDPPRQTGNTAWLYLTRDGNPVPDAVVGVEAMMPEMGAMPEMRSRADVKAHGEGIWSASFDLEMGGGWTLEVTVDGKMAALQFTVGSRGLIGDAGSSAPPGPVEVDLAELDLSPEALAKLRQAYLISDEIRARLAVDTLEGVDALAADLLGQLPDDLPEPADAWRDLAAGAAARLAESSDMTKARDHYSELMRGLITIGSGSSALTEGFFVFVCPMTEGFGKWVQVSGQLHNPYMGKSMPGCGTPSTWIGLGPVPGGAYDDAAVTIEPIRQQRFGIRTTRVTRGPVTKRIRALGQVAWADGEVSDVSLTTGGWVRRLRVDAQGMQVRRGQVLFELYSPDLYTAQQEFLLSSTRAPEDPLRVASRQKLLLMGLAPHQLDQLLAAGKPWEQVPILSPVSGYVVDKNIVEGTAFQPGAVLFRIAPLGRVWVEAEVYAEDVPFVDEGTPARISLPTAPDGDYQGAVSQLLPVVSPVQHTRTVRLVLDNPDERLLPGMYADVWLDVPLEDRLVVPETAVIYTGTRRLVFVDGGNGRLVPREVRLGARVEDGWIIEKGVADGEAVVTTGTFLVAAESRMRAATDLWEAR